MENQNNGLQLQEEAFEYLRESAKWSMFLAILGFVGIGFLAIAALLMTSLMSFMPETPGPFGAIKGFISILYLVMAIVYLFPIYYLYKYATDTKAALQNYNSETLTNAFKNLKSHHKFLGIASIIIIALYIVLAIVAVIAFAAFR